jgi:hypothetical protein
MRAWILCDERGTNNKVMRSDANYCHLWQEITGTDLQIEHWSKVDCCSTYYVDVKTTINRDGGMNIVWWAWHQKHLLRSDANYCCLWLGVTWADLQIELWSKIDSCSTRQRDVRTTINRDEGMNIVWWTWHQKQTYALRCELLLSLSRNNLSIFEDRTLIKDWLLFNLTYRCQNNHQSGWGHECFMRSRRPNTDWGMVIAVADLLYVFNL